MAQRESYGTWTSFGVDKKLNKWNLSAETELRTIYYLRLIDRWSLGFSTDYSILKQLKVGVGYEFMNTLDKKYLNYQFRNRFNVSTAGKLKFQDFTFSLREKIQLTFKDESKRIRSDGSIDVYSVNPEWDWRNKMQISYNIPHCRISPALSVETFYELNNPDGNGFDNFRYTLSFTYKINKRNSFEVYGLFNDSPGSDEAFGKYILGGGYSHSF